MKIDIHTHAFPEQYVANIERRLASPPEMRTHWIWNPDVYLREMDEWGVDVKVLSMSAPSVYFDDLSLSLDMSRLSNEAYAEICARWPDRFKMFVSVPMGDADVSCRELEQAKSLPGYVGIALGSNILGKMLDEPAFGTFFKMANAMSAVIFIHPMGYRASEFELPEPWKAYRLHHLIGWPLDTTFAISRLVLGGFFDRYPNLQLIAAHVGGAIPYLSERLERGFQEGRAKNKPSYYFRKNILYDTAGPTHPAIIDCAVKIYGIDRILFGTDYPFGTGQEGMQYMEKAIWNVDHSELSAADRGKIFSGNSCKILLGM
jgi:aminocarboxymuconate-semialdehyde decarboxylase